MIRKLKIDWLGLLVSEKARKIFQKRWNMDEREFERKLCWNIRLNKNNAHMITKALQSNGSIDITQGARGRTIKVRKGASWKL